MENENEITDKTYTLNSVSSYFDDSGFCLDILLPAESKENPYSFIAYDLTQLVDNSVVNAVLVFMKKQDDNGNDLSGDDDDVTIVNHSCMLTNLEKLTGLAGLCDFETKNTETLVIICHDCSQDKPYLSGFAEKVYLEVPTIYTNVANNGNFQTTLNLMGNDPKKSGMSTFHRK